jgi:hypothetical protein
MLSSFVPSATGIGRNETVEFNGLSGARAYRATWHLFTTD